jgi:hypothetical protein
VRDRGDGPPFYVRLGLAGLLDGFGFLRDLFADHVTRHSSEVVQALADSEAFGDRMPSRNTITNRLNDLEKQGYLRRVGRGRYERVQTNGARPHDFAPPEGGATETIPDHAEGVMS